MIATFDATAIRTELFARLELVEAESWRQLHYCDRITSSNYPGIVAEWMLADAIQLRRRGYHGLANIVDAIFGALVLDTLALSERQYLSYTYPAYADQLQGSLMT